MHVRCARRWQEVQGEIAVVAARLLLCFPWTVPGLGQGPPDISRRSPTTSLRQERFEVASLKLADPKRADTFTHESPWGSSRFSITNASLPYLLQIAYGVNANQISGLPAWQDSQAYNMEAKAEDGTILDYKLMQPMLQHLLEERLGLKIHRAIKEFSGYWLVVAPGGPKLKASDRPSATGYIMSNRIWSASASVATLASMMPSIVGGPVVDKTGIEGTYNIDLRFARQDGGGDQSSPGLFTAVQEQLGLKLQPMKVPLEMVVVDHVERSPTED